MLPPDLPTWGFIQWAITGVITAVSLIIAWAFRIHYTVGQHSGDISMINQKMEAVATKSDVGGIRDDIREMTRRLDAFFQNRQPSRD